VELRISAANFIPIVMAGLAWHLCGHTQDKPKASSNVPTENCDVSCYEGHPGRLVGPNKMRTFVLESSDGRYRAYAETEVLSRKKRNTHGEEYVQCENTSRLFVAGPQSRGFRQVMIVLPKGEPEPLLNDIGLVDWCPKGHRLLIAEGLWGDHSDFGGILIRIYDADSNKLSSETFVDDVFRRHAGKECTGVFQPTGFSEDGGITVKAGPYFDVGEDQPRADSCLPKEGIWLIGPVDDAIRQLPDSYKPKHYGKEVTRESGQ
jgi:hypothetical protein